VVKRADQKKAVFGNDALETPHFPRVNPWRPSIGVVL
jgi:hypothetical protein